MSDANGLDQSWGIQNEASSLGFDWPDISGVIEKVKEEIAEIEDALRDENMENAREELGDLLFATVNLARFLDQHPNDAMVSANQKFLCRFNQVRQIAKSRGLDMKRCSLDQLDAIWDEVKRGEGGEKK